MIRRNLIALVLFVPGYFASAQAEIAINNQAVELMDEERYEEALVILDKLVQEYPTVTKYRENRAATYFGLKEFSKCVDDYKILLETFPEAEYAFQIANAFEHMDSFSNAIAYYSKAVELENDNYLTFFKRGTVFLKMKNFTRATEDFSQAIKLNPDHHNSFHNRGIALYQSDKQELACSDWCQAMQLGNTYSAEHLKKNCKTIPASCK
jgi:tetratricopeptide (TPR) repeat protein